VVDHNLNTSQWCSATAVTFSVKCLNPLKIYPLSTNIFRKWFALYIFFIYSRAFNKIIFISNGKSDCCNDTYRRLVYIAASEECLRRLQIIFMLLESPISLAILSEIFIHIDYFY